MENLQNVRVNTEHVKYVSGKATGKAQINVAENGDNQIVIIAGANDTITPEDIDDMQDVLDASKVQL